MKTITMSDLRAEPGEVFRAVQRGGETFQVTKSGKVAGYVVPDVSTLDGVVVERDGTVRGDASILRWIGLLRAGSSY